jgi:hypothetical protein
LSGFLSGATLLGILLTFKGPKSRRKRKDLGVQPLKHCKVPLDELETKFAIELGDGDLALGIRRAIILAAMRQPKTQCIERLAGLSGLFASVE